MGFAKYQEDILSRYVHDNHVKGNGTVQQRGHGTKPRRPPTTKEAVAMSPLKEFTVQSARPLPVLILADVSGSMNTDGKIQALNLAVREMVEAFKDEADLLAEIHLGVITFGGQAKVHQPLVATQNVTWSDLAANGTTPMGKAFDLARELIEDRNTVPGRAYRPTIVLVSDGKPTDEWEKSMADLLASERGGKAFRMALAIGDDADTDVLQRFLVDPKARVFHANEARQIRNFFKFVTMSVSQRSRSASPNTVVAVQATNLDDYDF